MRWSPWSPYFSPLVGKGGNEGGCYWMDSGVFFALLLVPRAEHCLFAVTGSSHFWRTDQQDPL